MIDSPPLEELPEFFIDPVITRENIFRIAPIATGHKGLLQSGLFGSVEIKQCIVGVQNEGPIALQRVRIVAKFSTQRGLTFSVK